ncbi:MAG: hypothetical protein IKK20_02550, partial [Clostridia bacterium]|nr:hypothetical protein [Clostridia bacterium]
ANSLTPQEQLLNGTLELDPENDPVIYTTDYGLDIKWHLAGLPVSSNDIAIMQTGEKFAGYAYFTTKGYNNQDVNWVIIGYSNQTFNLSGVINLSPFINYYSEYSNSNLNILQIQDTDAATEIYDAHINGPATFYGDLSTAKLKSALFPNAKPSDELEGNEVLCFAQGLVTNSSGSNKATFGGNNKYSTSNLRTVMNTYHTDYLQSLPIEPQPLTTIYLSAKDTDATNEYLFPLASRRQATIDSATVIENFVYSTYLTTGYGGNMDVGAYWWLRSGNASRSDRAVIVRDTGDGIQDGYYTNCAVGRSNGLRPAFVLKI